MALESDDTGQSPRFMPVKIRRGFEQIYEQIRTEIAEGRLSPGDRLPAEREMAAMFGVSRQAVREALRGLEVSGLVDSRVGVNGGAFVRKGDPSVLIRSFNDLAALGNLSYDSLLEARILITNDAIRLAVERATEEDLARLEADTDLIDEYTRKGELELRAEARVNFYNLLGEATHNEVFSLFLNSLTDIVRTRLRVAGHNAKDDLVATRRKIIAALRARDAESAIETMVDHFQRLEVYLLEEETKLKRDGVNSNA